MLLHKLFFALLATVCLSAVSQAKPTGMIVGRTGDILHVSVPQPLDEGTIVEVTLADNATADARVLACTREWPYIALAKSGDAVGQGAVPAYGGPVVPMTAIASAREADIRATDAVKPARKEDARFSIQGGGFYPTNGLKTGTYLDVWQSYRMDYSFLRLGSLETQVSAEYLRGFAKLGSGEHQVNRTMQVIPLTLMGKVKPFRVGSWKMFVGAGGTYCPMYSQDTCDGITSFTKAGALGEEFSAGVEGRGWMLEARYKNVPNTEIKGYTLSLGTRF